MATITRKTMTRRAADGTRYTETTERDGVQSFGWLRLTAEGNDIGAWSTGRWRKCVSASVYAADGTTVTARETFTTSLHFTKPQAESAARAWILANASK